MPFFKVGTTVDTADVSNVVVEIDPAAPMQTGKYTFQLIVEDSDHAVSDPTRVTVVILDNVKPTAVIDGPQQIQVPFGSKFALAATGSHANAPAIIVRYSWTLLAAG